jgi:hypothetical protein
VRRSISTRGYPALSLRDPNRFDAVSGFWGAPDLRQQSLSQTWRDFAAQEPDLGRKTYTEGRDRSRAAITSVLLRCQLGSEVVSRRRRWQECLHLILHPVRNATAKNRVDRDVGWAWRVHYRSEPCPADEPSPRVSFP